MNFNVIWEFILQWYWIPLVIINVIAFITILIENGKPEKTIAWLMVIVFLPVVGVVLYYFFGQKFQKNKHFRKLDDNYSKKLSENWDLLQPFIDKEIKLTALYDDRLNDAFEYLTRTKNSISTSSNQVVILHNGEEKFPELIKDLKNAKHHIHLEYYIFDDDEIGNQILNILIEKVKQNIKVKLIIDDFGSPKLAKKKALYEKHGIDFEVFLPVHFNSLANSNYRNHRKIAIIDGEIGYVGGINISDKYINSTKNKLYWRDTAIRINGDAVKILQLQFWLHWQGISKNRFSLNKNYLPKTKNLHEALEVPITFAFSSPGNNPAYIMEVMIQSILSARKSVLLTSPYFIPTDAFKTALLIAVSKGIDVKLIIPYKGDSAIVQAANLSFLKPFIERGMKVFLYKKGFIHAKTICIDNTLSYVGTTNLDARSFHINFELSALILNKKISEEMTNAFYSDIENSVLFTKEFWESKKWYYRTFASICRLLSPLL